MLDRIEKGVTTTMLSLHVPAALHARIKKKAIDLNKTISLYISELAESDLGTDLAASDVERGGEKDADI